MADKLFTDRADTEPAGGTKDTPQMCHDDDVLNHSSLLSHVETLRLEEEQRKDREWRKGPGHIQL